MSDPKWQDHALSDIIETQHLLFFHLSGALHRAGVLHREVSAEALRETAKLEELRPGVRSCLRAVAKLLEQPATRPAPPAWEPRVVPGAGVGEGPQAEARLTGTGRRGNGRAGNGQAANGDLPAGWRPTVVGDPDPDCDPDSDPDCA
ncbi:MAG: hypothetical protein R3285_00860 [Kiloniellales bacterium]|nr:hypothetical protein [Kiloniellales bacterium]